MKRKHVSSAYKLEFYCILRMTHGKDECTYIWVQNHNDHDCWGRGCGIVADGTYALGLIENFQIRQSREGILRFGEAADKALKFICWYEILSDKKAKLWALLLSNCCIETQPQI